jgi:hypothetical protein
VGPEFLILRPELVERSVVAPVLRNVPTGAASGGRLHVCAAKGPQPGQLEVASIAERFGLSFDFTEVPDLVARHGLRARR